MDWTSKSRVKSCNMCADIEGGLMSHAHDYSFEGRKKMNFYLDLFLRHDPDTHETKPPKTTHVGNGKHQGWFAGTLTKSPDWDETEEDMCVAISKIFSQNTNPVDKYVWYLEYTDAKLPHIHFLYLTKAGGRITAKIFKRYWKQWDEKRKLGKGHQGGYHRSVESLIAYKEYIEKDSGRHGSFGMEDVVFG